ncbi:bifunctional UDP-N-acetylglucosamine diphosphorylase/glucosamine-1-phosphate N-acetyltransferase GlmU [Sphingosinicella soli]|uniref:Bifunctional protein GlmU n=1 Tax=Sphingosinicella soli TaxID=333708 RepID=A0A7W7F7T4_9SPHN|nr:bifunctional UDP-N-acetylglucosamine diphosphorylase/glucosamine-1-phosphate N-acetyltransferase GlmU [Sphingosinicella soli]MBB4633004.1 bifunctional UDP-N-acetylglucosamine pyrophosphorylase/glucosamine-1-phosphate N-acetyltransferase [Sphingosinicella soli]
MSRRPVAAIILAAGMGTRMKSETHKVLHPIGGRPMLLHLMASVDEIAPERTVVVVGARREQVEAAVAHTAAVVVTQEPQLGTAHAVLQAKDALAGFEGDVLVLYGDVPFIESATMRLMLSKLNNEKDTPAAVVLGFRAAEPGAYGRIDADDGVIRKMVEFKDASPAERDIDLCNSGLLAVRADDLWPLLERVGNDNAAGEYYLPDIVMLANADGRVSRVVETAEAEVMGINSRAELAVAEARFQAGRRSFFMREGVTLTDPGSVFFAFDTEIAADVSIAPNVVFGPGVSVGAKTRIHAFSHIEGAKIGEKAEIGPYARLRPGTVLGADVKIGNFVETKKADFADGAKANHLSYIGDATVGAKANIGAGTITCNYDGFFKYKTEIGAGAFIGSNSALVAPVKIGDGAIVGAGSVMTKDVEADALAVARGVQDSKPGWAARFREAMTAKKKAAK